MGTVTDYLATVEPPARRAALERVVRRAHELVPDLVEATAYGMPVLTHRGKGLLSAMATAKHLALYPHSGSVVALVAGSSRTSRCRPGRSGSTSTSRSPTRSWTGSSSPVGTRSRPRRRRARGADLVGTDSFRPRLTPRPGRKPGGLGSVHLVESLG